MLLILHPIHIKCKVQNTINARASQKTQQYKNFMWY